MSGVGRVITQPVRRVAVARPDRVQHARARPRAAVDGGDGGPHDAVGDGDELVERFHAAQRRPTTIVVQLWLYDAADERSARRRRARPRPARRRARGAVRRARAERARDGAAARGRLRRPPLQPRLRLPAPRARAAGRRRARAPDGRVAAGGVEGGRASSSGSATSSARPIPADAPRPPARAEPARARAAVAAGRDARAAVAAELAARARRAPRRRRCGATLLDALAAAGGLDAVRAPARAGAGPLTPAPRRRRRFASVLVVTATISVTHATDPGCPWAYSAAPAPRGAPLALRRPARLAARADRPDRATPRSTTRRGYTPERGARGYLGFRRFGMPFDTQPRERNIAPAARAAPIVAARLLDPARELPVFRALQLARFTTTTLFDTDDGIRAALAARRRASTPTRSLAAIDDAGDRGGLPGRPRARAHRRRQPDRVPGQGREHGRRRCATPRRR